MYEQVTCHIIDRSTQRARRLKMQQLEIDIWYIHS